MGDVSILLHTESCEMGAYAGFSCIICIGCVCVCEREREREREIARSICSRV